MTAPHANAFKSVTDNAAAATLAQEQVKLAAKVVLQALENAIINSEAHGNGRRATALG